MSFFGFRELWALDAEFRAPPGERPTVHCIVAIELFSGRVVRQWLADDSTATPAFDTGPASLCIAYFSSAEWACFLVRGWELPVHVIDLFVEFRNLTNGVPPPFGNGLLGAMLYFGLPTVDAEDKAAMQALAQRDGPFTEAERSELLAYCESDVRALQLLWPKMWPTINVPHALLRGRYMKAVARMEAAGIPVDVELYEKLVTHWDAIKNGLVAASNETFGVFVDGHFSHARFADWLVTHGIQWPRTVTGRLMIDSDTFKDMARVYPKIIPLQQMLQTLGKFRLSDLSIGSDGRNRTLLSAFRSRTSRNQPSNSQYVFGLAAWLRCLIRPNPGRAIAYIDYEQQEFGIGAALSPDFRMLEAYETGDPYLAFAKQAGAVPPDATKTSHKKERSQFKQCSLGVQYGMMEYSLATRIDQSAAHARLLIEAHRRTYPAYWRWAERAVDFAMLHGWIETVLGWRLRVGVDANPRSLQNFPCQANGAEILRLACIFATERGVTVNGPIHDAVLIEASDGDIDAQVATTRQAMADASRVVLGGIELRTDAMVVRWPHRYFDERAEQIWPVVMGILERLSPEVGVHVCSMTCGKPTHPSNLVF